MAEALQMPKGTLTHKLNPTNFTHHLTLREALLMQRATGSTVLLEAEAGFWGRCASRWCAAWMCCRRPKR